MTREELAQEALSVLQEMERLGKRAAALYTILAALGDTPAPEPTPEPEDPVEPPEKPSKADWECYLDRYEDVAKNGPRAAAWAIKHYQNWGKNEGRVWGCVEDAPVNGSKRFHHYNASAWHDRGVACILCPGDHADWVRIGNTELRKHGNQDKGRDVWADYTKRGLTGTLQISIDGVVYSTVITDDGGMTRGDCWRS